MTSAGMEMSRTCGWEGSAVDATVWMNARLTDLPIPANKFYLADAGFGACDALLTPYHGARYHFAEWARTSVRYVLEPMCASTVLIFYQARNKGRAIQSTTCASSECC